MAFVAFLIAALNGGALARTRDHASRRAYSRGARRAEAEGRGRWWGRQDAQQRPRLIALHTLRQLSQRASFSSATSSQ